MAKFKIHIPEPCHEDWSVMSEAERGRHCSHCNKVVVDFSFYTKDQFEKSFADIYNKRESVCGRFSNNQIAKKSEEKYFEIEYRKLKLSPFQMFVFAFVFSFFLGGFSSCKVNDDIVGIPIVERNDGLTVKTHLENFDTLCKNDHFLMGEIVIKLDTTTKIKDTTGILINSNTHKINFVSNSYELNEESKKMLDNFVFELKKQKKYSIEIIGHTDSLGTEKLNKELSLKRAESVKYYLEKQGIIIATSRGVGYQFPLGDNTSMAGRARNRRVEIIVKTD